MMMMMMMKMIWNRWSWHARLPASEREPGDVDGARRSKLWSGRNGARFGPFGMKIWPLEAQPRAPGAVNGLGFHLQHLNSKDRKIENSKIRKLKIEKLKIWKIEKLKFWKLKIQKSQNPKIQKIQKSKKSKKTKNPKKQKKQNWFNRGQFIAGKLSEA